MKQLFLISLVVLSTRLFAQDLIPAALTRANGTSVDSVEVQQIMLQFTRFKENEIT